MIAVRRSATFDGGRKAVTWDGEVLEVFSPFASDA